MSFNFILPCYDKMSSEDFIDEDRLNKELSNVFNFSMKEMYKEIENQTEIKPGTKAEIYKNNRTENDLYDYNLNFLNFPLIDTFFNNPPITSEETTYQCTDETCHKLGGVYKVKIDKYKESRLLVKNPTKRSINVKIDENTEYDIFRITLDTTNDDNTRYNYLYRKLNGINEFFKEKYKKDLEFYLYDIEEERFEPDCLTEEREREDIEATTNRENRAIVNNIYKRTIMRNVYVNTEKQESGICFSDVSQKCKFSNGEKQIDKDMTAQKNGYNCQDALDSKCINDCKNYTLKTFLDIKKGEKKRKNENITEYKYRIFLKSLEHGAVQSFKDIGGKHYGKTADEMIRNCYDKIRNQSINILLTFRKCKNVNPTLVCVNIYTPYSSKNDPYENSFIFDYYNGFNINNNTLPQYELNDPNYFPHVHSLHFPNSVKNCENEAYVGGPESSESPNPYDYATAEPETELPEPDTELPEESNNSNGGNRKTKHRKNKTKRSKTKRRENKTKRSKSKRSKTKRIKNKTRREIQKTKRRA